MHFTQDTPICDCRFEENQLNLPVTFCDMNENLNVAIDEYWQAGTTNHNELHNRELPNQHPIESITGLKDALNKKLDLVDTFIIDCGDASTNV